jgi:hypothetical protein
MKRKLSILFLVTVLALTFSTAAVFAQAPQKAPKRIYTPQEHFGYIPPPHDVSHIQPSPLLQGALLPATWDWRMAGVSSVKNQNPYGT